MQEDLTIHIEISPLFDVEVENMAPHFEDALESGLLTEKDVEQILLDLLMQNLEVT